MDSAQKGPRDRKGRDGDHARRADHVIFDRAARAFHKAANDNRLGLRGWLERVAALALLIALAALLAWKVAG